MGSTNFIKIQPTSGIRLRAQLATQVGVLAGMFKDEWEL